MVVRESRRVLGSAVGLMSLASLAILLTASLAGAFGGTNGGARNRIRIAEAPRLHSSSSGEPLHSADSYRRASTINLPSSEMARTGATARPRRFLSEPSGTSPVLRRLVAVPPAARPKLKSIRFLTAEQPIAVDPARLGDIARIEFAGLLRDQSLAWLVIDTEMLAAAAPATGFRSVDFELTFEGSSGRASLPTGPFSRVCARAIANYDIQAEDSGAWTPTYRPARSGSTGSVTYCQSVADCAQNGIDMLFIVAEQLASAPSLAAYAAHHAGYFGLNVGILDAGDLPELTPEAIRQFIQDVYDTQSAEHFGDGHLGFVLLVGDAYADDNETNMIPAYYGYGGTESASDHYYACVSGDDDFEDVMVGRLSVGNLQELVALLTKSSLYMPHTEGEVWHERVLLIAGLFYTTKEKYVELFDEYDELIPEGVATDRIYRHDYDNSDDCALDVVEGFNEGYLFANFNGDGWISSWHQTLNTTHIPLIQNQHRLPILLSMACNTGRFDNVTYTDANGSYDCLIEQMLNASEGGAVAAVAAPRASDGGIFRSFTKEIYNAAFEQRCVFTGELLATAKLLHLQNEGDVSYARQFNLFGDPTLIFASESEPAGQPDLAVKPYDTTWSPEFAVAGEDVSVFVGVENQSAVTAPNVLVRIAGTSDAGSYEYEQSVVEIGPWETAAVPFTIPSAGLGNHEVVVSVDPDDTISELEEDDNSFSHSFYAYPTLPGFPVQLGLTIHSPCVSHVGIEDERVLVPDEDGRIWALGPGGAIEWASNPSWGPSHYGREIAAASGDLDGDGTNEVIGTKFMGITALDANGGELWIANTDDPVGYPVLADGDSDGDLDVVVSTRAIYGGASKIVAIDEDGSEIWQHTLPQGVDITTTPVVGDFDLDGHIDLTYGTSTGMVEALSCATLPPSELWSPFSAGTLEVRSLGLADLDSDGLLEIAVAGDGVRCVNAESGTDAGLQVSLDGPVVGLAIGDADGDGDPEMIAATSAGTVSLIDGGSVLWSRALSGVPGSSATVADVDGSGTHEILIGTEAGYLHVLTGDGVDLVSPVPLDGACLTPFAADLTGDSKFDVVACSSEGTVYCLTFGGQIEQTDKPDWQGLGGSASRASILEQPYWGTINGNLVLSGNFHIVDDLIIPSGSTLTVASGTQMLFDGAALEIGGTMFAPGIPGNPIVLCSSSEQRDRWSGIEAHQGADIALSSCVVTDADTALEARQCAVSLIDCQLTDSGMGASLEDVTFYANGTSFSNCDGLGLSIEGGSGSVIACTVDGNGTGGLEALDASDYRFVRSGFSGTTNGHGAAFRSFSNSTVDSCSFDGNSGSGVLVKRSSPKFEMCEFTDNSLYGMECERLSMPWMSWSTVTGNRIGVVASASSVPNLGDDMVPDSGYNSVYGNQQAAVANLNSEHAPLYARRNWWGADPPAGRIFMGYVIYLPWLSEAPDPSLMASDVAEVELPAKYALSQNAPNPFNPRTTLSFSVPPSAGPVSISVYDASGRLVRSLFDGPSEPGKHRVTWDGRDGAGNRVASGIYFARMIAPDFAASRKMILIK
ncbi:MAG: T9SS type A sorting domain-containing protein [Candidatus Eisenbacteria bacterium]|nr:T9SS type A sorting domain-containing protein [Candidatus Eisenbacteria bacterium]